MSYYGIPPAYYEEFQPGTPWHQGARGWSRAPVPGWGANPALVGPRRLAMHGCSACGQAGEGNTVVKALAIVAALGAGAWLLFRDRSTSGGYKANRRRYRSNRCRGRGGPYLIPSRKKYPVPSKRCARTALTYAGWPNNIDDAAEVLRNLKKTQWADDPDVRAQARQLARVYEEETGRTAPRV